MFDRAVRPGDLMQWPFGVGLEQYDGLDHPDRGGIEGGLGPAHLAHDLGHLGDGADELVLGLEHPQRLAQTAGGGDGRHVEQ